MHRLVWGVDRVHAPNRVLLRGFNKMHKEGVLSSAVVVGAAAGAISAGKLAESLGPRHAQVGVRCCCRLTNLHNEGVLSSAVVVGAAAGASRLASLQTHWVLDMHRLAWGVTDGAVAHAAVSSSNDAAAAAPAAFGGHA